MSFRPFGAESTRAARPFSREDNVVKDTLYAAAARMLLRRPSLKAFIASSILPRRTNEFAITCGYLMVQLMGRVGETNSCSARCPITLSRHLSRY